MVHKLFYCDRLTLIVVVKTETVLLVVEIYVWWVKQLMRVDFETFHHVIYIKPESNIGFVAVDDRQVGFTYLSR